MKQILYLFLGIFLLASCQQEELLNAETGYGYLSVSELSVATTQVHVVSSRADEEPLTIEILKLVRGIPLKYIAATMERKASGRMRIRVRLFIMRKRSLKS